MTRVFIRRLYGLSRKLFPTKRRGAFSSMWTARGSKIDALNKRACPCPLRPGNFDFHKKTEWTLCAGLHQSDAHSCRNKALGRLACNTV